MSMSVAASDGQRLDGTPRGNYFARHWRGELSLGTSYWLNGALLGNAVPLILVGLALGNQADDSSDLRVTASLQLSAIVMSLIAYLWSAVGIWRSAGHHVARGGRAGWASAAKVMLVLGTLSVFGSWSRAHVVDQCVELAQIAFGRDPMPKIDVRKAPDGRSILLSGTLGTGSAAVVRSALDAAPDIKLLHLHSSGGRLFEARSIASEVRRRGMDTYVEGLCASACTMVFLAGRDRGATPNARIGFHRPSFAGSDDNSEAGAEQMVAFYRAAGASSAFIDRVRNTPSASLWYPTRDELLANRIVTRVSLGGETSMDLAHRGIKTADDVAKLLLAQPLWQAIDRRVPGSVARAADAAWQASRRGASDDQMLSSARAIVAELVPQALNTAPDEVLEQFLDLSRTEMSAALAVSPLACAKLLDSQLNIVATLPKAVVEQELVFMQALFSTDPRRDAGSLSKSQAENALTPVLAKLSQQQLKVIGDPSSASADPQLRCTSMLAYFDGVAQLPPPKRRLALRAMFQS